MNQTATLQIAQVKVNMSSVVWALFAVFIVLLALYGVLVRQTVFNVVSRQQSENKITDLNSKIGDLEFKYMTATNNITIEMAYAKGFKDVTDPSFITRTTLGQVATAQNLN